LGSRPEPAHQLLLKIGLITPHHLLRPSLNLSVISILKIFSSSPVSPG
jgi:hypothetical protein